MPFVYSEKYFAVFGDHVFPVEKYRLTRQRLDRELPDAVFHEPAPASREDLLTVHSAAYLDDLDTCTRNERTLYSELPLTAEIIAFFKLAVGGTLEAVRLARQAGWAVHIGGGFHHAFRDRAEGFCYLNDLAVAAKKFQAQKRGGTVLVVDLDLHQGNGTARIFQDDPDIFTFSMHQENIYPEKERSDLDVPLAPGTDTAAYLRLLDEALAQIMASFSPDLILYQAGADPFRYDQLGDLSLTKAGLRRRDQRVIAFAAGLGVPIAATFGGGYAYNTRDTVDIHLNTCLAFHNHFHGIAAG